jgi:ABC-type phosphate/phosphonate transport system substrate-binding protein
MAALWSRDDLGAALMCGLPYSLRTPRPQLIAAPIPSPPRYGGRPRYMTDLAVRADSPYGSIEDTFGSRIGYTVADSQSGYFAVRHYLAPFQRERGAPLYREVVGGLLNARGVIDAVVAGKVDVGPLDSYSHDLLAQWEPEYAAQVRTVATTEPTPIPAFVATASLAAGQLDRVRIAFAEAGAAPELERMRTGLLLSGFAMPAARDYDVLHKRHDALIAAPEVW